ncbi:ABC transporter substrate-binding protein [uncultured Cetobacterium sp.]|uniref:ABC transporter substrate-binding protein n=1 Tax=uncultured Cetobacterium sp. TaxID=527638 RepID=UPI002624597E|nr:ABC transporter substrate-binding protein [uncultured Cetobacterium sp.]
MYTLKLIIFFIFMISNTIFSKDLAIKNKTFNVVQESDPRTFDPHFGNDGFSLRINRLIYSRLFEKDSNMNTTLGIVKTYKFIDNKNIDFTLKDDIYFQNGDKLTSDDVKFSFERMKNSPRISAFLPPVQDIIIKDEKNFTMILSNPFSPIIDQLTHPALSIVSKKYLEGNPEILITKPMGSGKYILKEWIPGESVVLERFENYFENKPSYEIINIKTIPLATNRTFSLETGEADLAFSLPVQDKKIIDKNTRLKYISKPSFSYTYMGLNLNKTIFNDIDIRKAIDLAVDKTMILEVVLNGQGKIANSPVADGVKGYNKNLKNEIYNKDKANRLMNNRKINLTLATMNNSMDIQIAELITGYLKEIGISVNISVLDNNIYWLKTNQGEFDMFIGSWGSITGDSDYALYPTHHSTSFGSSGNRTFFKNERVDSLLDKARNTLNQNERNQIYMEIQEIIVQNHGEVMLFYRDLNGGISSEVKGFEMYPIPIHDYSLGTIY